jgi:two-component system nitrate/nitrite response regulator NarL
MTDRPIRIVIVDDHPMFRDGVTRSLSGQPDIDVCGEGASAESAIQLDRDLKPDVMLLDLSMPGGGHNALSAILEQSPEARVLVLTASEEDGDVLDALRAGARGYVLKGVSAAALLDIVRGVVNGESYVSPSLAARILTELRVGSGLRPDHRAAEAPDALSTLTRREEEILRLVAAGNSNKEVARRIDLQEKTIKHHMTRILQKLNVRNRTEAAMLLRDLHDRG